MGVEEELGETGTSGREVSNPGAGAEGTRSRWASSSELLLPCVVHQLFQAEKGLVGKRANF